MKDAQSGSIRHGWDLSPATAIALQQELRHKVVLQTGFGPDIRRIAGIDVGFEEDGRITRAAVAILDYPGLTLTGSAVARLPTTFPYIPGLLSFREAPAILSALDMLEELPELLIVDGQGYAHPRRLGIACHLGILTGLPAIGVGKTRLTGRHGDVPEERGHWTPLLDRDEVIGAVLRTRQGVHPLYISAGHRIDLVTALDWVMQTTGRYRLPEPIRHAHRLASGGKPVKPR